MAFKIEERFEVQAPVERTWKYLIDPARVVQCLPGAELLESQDEHTFLGAIKVKVGPLAMSYKGQARFTEVDDQAHRVQMVGEAREVGGSGSTKITMVSTVTALPEGGSEVLVNAEIDLVGKIVQFGRGMIEEVSRQMFRQFSTCVKAQLENVVEVESSQQSVNEEAQFSDKGTGNESKAVSAIPLALRALWAIIVRFFQRLFGKDSDN
jgi:carbon monoxide dehydrogenase subunit G